MDFSILSKYDDLLANYFLDNLLLWFPTIRMNSDVECGTVNTNDAIPIIRQRVVEDLNPVKAAKELIQLPYFQEFLQNKNERQAFEFSQHMRRYICMFMPRAGFEVSSTTRYTGKIEACIVATQEWNVGQQVSLCQGSIAKLTVEEDERLKSEGRDFSVMVSTRKRCACLFLGPARFMNHDCDANCEFIIVGSNAVTFKVNKDIKPGDEMTVFYGKHYFGEDNCECLCVSCERRQEGSFSKLEKTVVNNKLPMNEDDPRTRRSSRKRRGTFKSRSSEWGKHLEQEQSNHTNPNNLRLLLPNDENQSTPEIPVATEEKTMQEFHDSLTPEIPENIAVTEDNSQQMDFLNNESLPALDNAKQSEDANSISNGEAYIVDTEEQDLTESMDLTQVQNDINGVSTEITELHLIDSQKESHVELDGHNIHEVKIPEEESTPDNCLPNNITEGEESIVPDVGTCDKDGEDITNETVVNTLLERNNSNTTILKAQETTCGTSENNMETSQLADDHTILSTSGNNTIIVQENIVNASDTLKEQISIDEDIVLSEGGHKEHGIVFSEGLSEKTKKAALFEKKDTIRQVRSVVIDIVSSEDDPINYDRLSAVRDIWIPAKSSDKKEISTALQQLKDDMQKKSDMEARTKDSLLRDMHEASIKMNKNKVQDLHNSACGETTVDNHEEIDEAIQKDETYRNWSKSASPGVRHSSETASTYSINTSDNSSTRDEYSPTPEPDKGRRLSKDTATCQTGSPQPSIDKNNSIRMVIENSHTESTSNEDDGNSSIPRPSASCLAHDPEAIIRRSEDPETTSQTLEISFVKNMDNSKLQQENNEAMVLDDLSRSYTSSSNNSVCFSSIDFDTADTNSPVSTSSNDGILIQQGDIETFHHQDCDIDLNTTSTITKASDLNDTVSISNVNTLNILEGHSSVDASQSDVVETSRPVEISNDTNTSSLTDPSKPVDSHLDQTKRGTTSDPLDSSFSITDTSIPMINTENSDDTLINTESLPVLSNVENINTNTNIEATNSSCLTIKIHARPISIKTCCPEFYKYSTGIDNNTNMCSRCLRHLQIFGVEWPKRICKRKTKYKTKGAKSNQKKELRTKPGIQKQRIIKNIKPIGDDELPELTFKNPLTSSDFNVASGMQHDVSNIEINQEESGAGIPFDKLENASNMDNSDNTDNSSSNMPKRKYRKSRTRKPYYYYEIVRTDEVPEPEPILEHPNKPYALRRSGNENDACEVLENASIETTLAETNKVSSIPRCEQNSTGKILKTSTKKVKQAKTSGKKSSKRCARWSPHRQKPQKTSDALPRPRKKQKHYYYYELVVENEATEEIPCIDDLDQPYHHRLRSKKKTHSDDGEKCEDTPSQQPSLTESQKEIPVQNSVVDEMPPRESSGLMKTTEDILLKQNESPRLANPLHLAKTNNITLQVFVNENNDKTNSASKDTVNSLNIQRSEEEVPRSRALTRNKTDRKKENSDYHSGAKEMNKPNHKDSSKNTINVTTRSSVVDRYKASAAQNSEETVTTPDLVNTRNEVMILPSDTTIEQQSPPVEGVATKKRDEKRRENKQISKPEDIQTLQDNNTDLELRKRALGCVEKFDDKPLSKRHRQMQSEKEDIAPDASESSSAPERTIMT